MMSLLAYEMLNKSTNLKNGWLYLIDFEVIMFLTMFTKRIDHGIAYSKAHATCCRW